MSEDETALRVAHLGQAVEKEIETSPTIALILEHAGEMSDGALAELRTCDPLDAKLIAVLQAKAAFYEHVETWINQTIMAGRHAAETIQRPGEDDREPA